MRTSGISEIQKSQTRQNNFNGQVGQESVDLFEQFSQTLEQIVSRIAKGQTSQESPLPSIELAKLAKPSLPTPQKKASAHFNDASKEPAPKENNPTEVSTDSESKPTVTKTFREKSESDEQIETQSNEPPSSDPVETEKSSNEEVSSQAISQATAAEAAPKQVTENQSQEIPQPIESKEQSDVATSEKEPSFEAFIAAEQGSSEDATKSGYVEQKPSERIGLIQTPGAQNQPSEGNASEKITGTQIPSSLDQGAQQSTEGSQSVEDSVATTPSSENVSECLDAGAPVKAKAIENTAKIALAIAKAAEQVSANEIGLEAAISTAILRHLTTPNGQPETASLTRPSPAHALQLLSDRVNSSDAGAMRTANFADTSRGDTQRAAVPKGQTKAAEARTMEKVENALKEVSRSKDGKTISVRLEPSNLGEVKVDVSLRDGNLHARLSADTAQVASMLKEKTHEIVSMLRKLGLHVDKVSVAVGAHEEQVATTSYDFQSYQSFQNFEEKKQQTGSNRGQQQGFSLPMMEKGNVQLTDHWIA